MLGIAQSTEEFRSRANYARAVARGRIVRLPPLQKPTPRLVVVVPPMGGNISIAGPFNRKNKKHGQALDQNLDILIPTPERLYRSCTGSRKLKRYRSLSSSALAMPIVLVVTSSG